MLVPLVNGNYVMNRYPAQATNAWFKFNSSGSKSVKSYHRKVTWSFNWSKIIRGEITDRQVSVEQEVKEELSRSIVLLHLRVNHWQGHADLPIFVGDEVPQYDSRFRPTGECPPEILSIVMETRCSMAAEASRVASLSDEERYLEITRTLKKLAAQKGPPLLRLS